MTTATKAIAAVSAVALAGLGGYGTMSLWHAVENAAQRAKGAVAAPTKPQVGRIPFPLNVNKWAISYQDAALGEIRGRASVNWDKNHADIFLVDPQNGNEISLSADEVKVEKANGEASLTMTLQGGHGPQAPTTPPPKFDGQHVGAQEEQSVKVKNASPEVSAIVRSKAHNFDSRVRLALNADGGAMRGQWAYFADPLTKRTSSGNGRSGYFRMLEDNELPDSPLEPPKFNYLGRGIGAGFLGETSGAEEWSPLPAVIDSTIVLNQLARSDKAASARFPYPFRDSASQMPEEALHRTLFVIGRNFPVEKSRLLADIDDRYEYGTKLHYHVDYWDGPSGRRTDLDSQPAYREFLQRAQANFDLGWKEALAPFSDAEGQIIRRQLDAALIDVTLKPDVLPGVQSFTWGSDGGATDQWFLQFGDNTAAARIVRRIRQKTAVDPNSVDEYESASLAFLPENLAVEIQTRAPLPLDKLPVQISASGGGALALPAERVPEHGGLYRTKLFRLSKPGGQGPGLGGSLFESQYSSALYAVAGILPLQPGETIRAVVKMDDVAFIAPPVAELEAYLTPERLGNPTVQQDFVKGTGALLDTAADSALRVRLWKDALQIVARANGLDPGDLSAVVGHKVGEYRPISVLHAAATAVAPAAAAATRPKGVPITGGEHAAMLLLKSEFERELREQLDFLDSLKSDDDIEGFRQWLVQFMAEPRPLVPDNAPPIGWVKYPDYLKAIEAINNFSAEVVAAIAKLPETILDSRGDRGNHFGHGTYFGELPVTAPNGRVKWGFFSTYNEDRFFLSLEPISFRSQAELRAWRVRAAREVKDVYRKAVLDTLSNSRKIGTNDLEELAKLTGMAYPALVLKLLPTLMTLDDSGKWVADDVGRTAVAGLHELAEAVQGEKDFVSLQNHAVIQIASTLLTELGVPLAAEYLLSEAGAKIFASAAHYGLLAWQGGEAIYDQALVRQDIDKYLGAVSILGKDRLDEAALKKTDYWKILGKLALDHGIHKIKGAVVEEVVSGEQLPLRLRSTEDRIGAAMRQISVQNAMPVVRRLSWSEVKKWPRSVVQGMLEMAAEAEEELVAARPLTTVDSIARSQVARLAHNLQDGKADTPGPSLVDEGPPPAVKWNLITNAPTGGGGPPSGPSGSGNAPTAATRVTRLEVYEADLAELEKELRPTGGASLGGGALPLGGAPGVVEASLPKTGNPARSGWFAVKEKDGTEVEYLFETDDKGNKRSLGGGSSSDVYAVKDVKGRDRGRLFEDDGIVLKKTKDDKLFGTAREQVLRMQAVYELVKAAASRIPGIRFTEVLEFHPDASEPYIIQKRLDLGGPGSGKKYVRISTSGLKGRAQFAHLVESSGHAVPQDFGEIVFPKEYQEALLQLYVDLTRVGLVALDLSLPNVVFRNQGGVITAEILDIDFIHPWPVQRPLPAMQGTFNFLENIDSDYGVQVFMPSLGKDARFPTDAETFMEKALEMPMGGNGRWRFIRVNPITGEFQSQLMDMSLVPKYFKNFKPKIEPTVRKGTRAVVPTLPWLNSIKEAAVEAIWIGAADRQPQLAF